MRCQQPHLEHKKYRSLKLHLLGTAVLSYNENEC